LSCPEKLFTYGAKTRRILKHGNYKTQIKQSTWIRRIKTLKKRFIAREEKKKLGRQTNTQAIRLSRRKWK
jgi:hypothetical protein